MTFSTREELKNHSVSVHSAAEARARGIIIRMPERRTVIVAVAITGVFAAGLVLQYYLRNRRGRERRRMMQ
ncbi:hypothetical protein Ngar_c33420 [Candidatus Nitrososphaera gargensis Ga9.2]|uniref:Transmembrane protein n=2 Tax=Candidatus Nitrososphaera gargensis TaxID=497727 RepID=K0IMG4_NITGG|nr:hypothetical protein Ngar_c33420 [Candidatus Nitrososphaera gargensis Ga9.2]